MNLIFLEMYQSNNIVIGQPFCYYFNVFTDKHVFCEKPIDLEPEEVIACYELAKEKRKTLQCGFDK